jgi:hypothetical protein
MALMHVAANILALIVLTVVPVLRPCPCSGFELVCGCATRAAAMVEDSAFGVECCGSGCAMTEEGHPDESPAPYGKGRPCHAPLAPELANGIVAVAASAVLVDASGADAVIAPPVLESLPLRAVSAVCWTRPPPTGLLVVRTHFLRI